MTPQKHWGCSRPGSTASQADLKAAIKHPFHALNSLLKDLLAWRPQIAPYLQHGPGLIAEGANMVPAGCKLPCSTSKSCESWLNFQI